MAWLGWFALLSPAPAQEPQLIAQADSLKRLSLEELSAVEVTSVTKEANPAFRTPAAVYVLTKEDIRASGAANLPDLLRLIPGVSVAQIDSVKWAIGIRGFQGRLSKSVRVLIDGRSVYTPLFAGVYWEMHDTLIQDIERIEVVAGPGGTIWGANAVNGVINIITKHSRDTHGMLVSAGGGNVEQGFLNWRYGGGSDQFSYRLYGKGFTRGPQFHSDRQNFDDWRMGQAGFRADWQPSARDAINFQGDAYGARAGQRLGISRFNPPTLQDTQGNTGLSGQNLMAGWKRTLRSGADIQLRGFFDRTDREDLNFRELRQAFDIDFLYHRPAGRHDFLWGGGARWSPAEFIQVVESVKFLPFRQNYNIYSAFLQDEITLAPSRWALTLGTKVEHNSFSGFEYQPSARIAWTPNTRNTLWAAVTRAVRTPSRIEEGFEFNALANPALPLFIRLIGDGQFTPEQLVGFEGGYRTFLARRLLISLAAFHNRYDDLLSVESRPLVAEESPPPRRLILPLYLRNGVQAQTSGMEIEGIWDVRHWLRLRGSYSYLGLDAKRQPGSNDASTVNQLERESPSHRTVAQAIFQLPARFEADLTFRHVSKVPSLQGFVPAYQTADVRIGRRFNESLDVSLVGRNLLQPSHIEYFGNPGPLVRIRRSAYAAITFTR